MRACMVLAAAKVGVPDYRRLVDQKLRTAGGAIQVHGGPIQPDPQPLWLELAVVIILIVDLFPSYFAANSGIWLNQGR